MSQAQAQQHRLTDHTLSALNISQTARDFDFNQTFKAAVHPPLHPALLQYISPENKCGFTDMD